MKNSKPQTIPPIQHHYVIAVRITILHRVYTLRKNEEVQKLSIEAM